MSEDDAARGPDETMSGRGGSSRRKQRLLVETNRWLLAGAIVAVFFLGTLAAAAVLPTRTVVRAGDPVETLFQALVTATITGVTLVVSINSLVLSQELGALGDQHDRMEASMSFRREVESELEIDVAAASPAAFLGDLIAAAGERGAALADAVAAAENAGVDTGSAGGYAAALQEHASAVGDDLSGRQFGTFGVLSAALDFNYSRKIHEARALRVELGDEANAGAETQAVVERLDGILAVLTLFGSAREHVKTLYFQWELVDLSRAILYAAVPAIVVATNVLLFYGALSQFTGTTVGVAHYVWLVAAATSVALVPFAVLLSFVLRIGSVAKRTLSIGPFVLRTETGDGGGHDAVYDRDRRP